MGDFETVSKQLPAYIRDPKNSSPPEGIESRRVGIYRDLFYQNIESFISNGFPILRSLSNDDYWHVLVRDFMANYRCQSPYFLEISQEFLVYLQEFRQSQKDDLPFMLELAHYEWVELALDTSTVDLSEYQNKQMYLTTGPSLDHRLLRQLPIVSPLAWSLAYQFPVHRIGESFQPTEADGNLSYLIVYRNFKDEVNFMEVNSVTARLLEILQVKTAKNGHQVLEQLAQEMRHPQPQQVIDSGLEILKDLFQLNIVVGVS